MRQVVNKLSLQEFLALPHSNERYEFIEGQLKLKMSPKYKHASSQGRLFRLLDEWCDISGEGRVCPEWGVVLRRNGEDWVTVPALTYVSYERLPQEWEEDEACPVLL
jgi:Uma2 family endonuclease